jgi:hypothetical protein
MAALTRSGARGRDRHVGLAEAAVFARGDLPDIGDDASSNFIEPSPTTDD